MFPNRHVGVGSANSKGGGIFEHLDRIRDEYSMIQTQVSQARQELEKVNQEKEQMQRQMMMYCEMAFSMNNEVMRQSEMAKKLNTVLHQVIPYLPHEQQATALATVERAKQVTLNDLSQAAAATSQAQLAMLSGGMGMQIPGAPFMGGPAGFPAAFAAALQMQAGAAAAHPGAMADRVPSAASRPRSQQAATPSSEAPAKKQKLQDHEDADDNLNIDVELDEPSGSGVQNGHSAPSSGGGGGRAKETGRESAQSITSSGASTPGIPKPPRNPWEGLLGPGAAAAAAAAAAVAGLPPGAAPPRLPPVPAVPPQAAALGMLDPHAQARMLAGMGALNGKPSYSFRSCDGGPAQPTVFPPDALTSSGAPKSLKKIGELPHGDVVCAVTIARDRSRVFTGGKGCVKVWEMPRTGADASPGEARVPLASLECLRDNYIRSCRLLPDASKLFVGGEASTISVWDVREQRVLREFDSGSQAVYALGVSNDERLMFACCADGKIVIWDANSGDRIHGLTGHNDGASCIDMMAQDDNKFWTGGLDSTVRCWDIRELRELQKLDFSHQIFSLGHCPTDNYVAVGTENNIVEVVHTQRSERYTLHMHDSCVLSLKFANSGNWFVSTGKDNAVNAWRTPYGANLFNYKENSSVLSCDISHDDQLLVTGNGEKRSVVYELQYGS